MIDQIKNIASRLAENHCDGSSMNRGMLYHDLPFAELAGMAAHRKGNKRRFRLMAQRYDFAGKSGIDLGCSVGGLAFRAVLAKATVVGVDYDPVAIEVANAVRDWRISVGDQLSANATFLYRDVVDYELPQCDFCIWFANFMWIWKLYGKATAFAKLDEVSRKCRTLFFTTAFGPGDGMAGDVVDMAPDEILAGTGYRNIVNLGVPRGRWHRRPMFMCW